VPSHASAASEFGLPVVLAGSIGYEPGLALGAGGLAFVDEASSPARGIWRSTDGGSTFRHVDFSLVVQRLPGGFDSDMAIGRDGRVFFASLSIVSTTFVRSTDGGASWSSATPLSTLPLSDRPWVLVGKPTPAGDTVYILYGGNTGAQLVRSRDSGTTWTEHVPAIITQATLLTGAKIPAGPPVANDAEFLAFATFDSLQNSRLWLWRSMDEGNSWERVGINRIDGQHVRSMYGSLFGGASRWTASRCTPCGRTLPITRSVTRARTISARPGSTRSPYRRPAATSIRRWPRAAVR
jgi:photosystem II stability/assembly factor-like uncharacterized protein